MRIKSVEAFWVHIPIPPERQHTSDFGRTLSFDGTLVRIDTECGLTGGAERRRRSAAWRRNRPRPAWTTENLRRFLTARTRRASTLRWERPNPGPQAHTAW